MADRFDSVNYAEARPGELLRSCLDIAETHKELGFSPQTSIDEGLKATKEYFWSK